MIPLSPYQNLGYTRMAEAIQRGEPLGDLLTGLSATRHTTAGADLLGGAVSGLVAAYFSIRHAGFTPSTDDAALQAFLLGTSKAMTTDLAQGLNGGDLDVLTARLSAVVGAVAARREMVNFEAVLGVATEPTTSVSVVSLPERITTTEIFRDPETLEIVRTVHTEVDAA